MLRSLQRNAESFEIWSPLCFYNLHTLLTVCQVTNAAFVPEIYQNDRISSGVIVYLRASRSARLAVNISHGLEMPLGFREKNLQTLPQMVKIIVHLAIVDRTSHRRSSFRKNAIIIVHYNYSTPISTHLS